MSFGTATRRKFKPYSVEKRDNTKLESLEFSIIDMLLKTEKDEPRELYLAYLLTAIDNDKIIPLISDLINNKISYSMVFNHMKEAIYKHLGEYDYTPTYYKCIIYGVDVVNNYDLTNHCLLGYYKMKNETEVIYYDFISNTYKRFMICHDMSSLDCSRKLAKLVKLYLIYRYNYLAEHDYLLVMRSSEIKMLLELYNDLNAPAYFVIPLSTYFSYDPLWVFIADERLLVKMDKFELSKDDLRELTRIRHRLRNLGEYRIDIKLLKPLLVDILKRASYIGVPIIRYLTNNYNVDEETVLTLLELYGERTSSIRDEGEVMNLSSSFERFKTYIDKTSIEVKPVKANVMVDVGKYIIPIEEIDDPRNELIINDAKNFTIIATITDNYGVRYVYKEEVKRPLNKGFIELLKRYDQLIKSAIREDVLAYTVLDNWKHSLRLFIYDPNNPYVPLLILMFEADPETIHRIIPQLLKMGK